MANDLNLNEIIYQADIRSKALRENYGDIQAEFNSLNAEVKSLVVDSTDNAEVIQARESMPSLLDNIRAVKAYYDFSNYYVINGLKVDENTGSDMRVTVSAGNGGIKLTNVSTAAVTSGEIAAAASGYHRYDAVYIDTAGTVAVTSGGEQLLTNAISIPDISSSQMMLGYFEVTDTTTAITSSMIIDTRNLVSGGVPTCYNVFTLSQIADAMASPIPDNTTIIIHPSIKSYILTENVTVGVNCHIISYQKFDFDTDSGTYSLDLDDFDTVTGYIGVDGTFFSKTSSSFKLENLVCDTGIAINGLDFADQNAKIYPQTKVRKVLHSGAGLISPTPSNYVAITTYADLYDELDIYMPNVGDNIAVSGNYLGDSLIAIYRSSSSAFVIVTSIVDLIGDPVSSGSLVISTRTLNSSATNIGSCFIVL